MENYILVEDVEYLKSNVDIERHFMSLEDERKKGINSVRVLDFNEKNNVFRVLLGYSGGLKSVEKMGSIKRTVRKYRHREDEGRYMTKREYVIWKRRQWNKFNLEEKDDNFSRPTVEDFQLNLVDEELNNLCGIFYEKPVVVEKPVKYVPDFLCNKFGDKDKVNRKKQSGFLVDDNAFVLPNLVGLTLGGFGNGKVYSVRVDNIDEMIGQDEFRDYIRNYGITNYKDIRLIMKKRKNGDGSYETSDENRGFGFVEFFSMVNAENAVELLDKKRIGYQLISASVDEEKKMN